MEIGFGKTEVKVAVAADDREISKVNILAVKQHCADFPHRVLPEPRQNLIEVGKLGVLIAAEPEVVVAERERETPVSDDIADGCI